MYNPYTLTTKLYAQVQYSMCVCVCDGKTASGLLQISYRFVHLQFVKTIHVHMKRKVTFCVTALFSSFQPISAQCVSHCNQLTPRS